MKTLRSSESVKCSECDKPLLKLITTNDVSYETKFIVECPYCGGASFTKKLNHHHKMLPETGLALQNVDARFTPETEKLKYGHATVNNNCTENLETVRLKKI